MTSAAIEKPLVNLKSALLVKSALASTAAARKVVESGADEGSREVLTWLDDAESGRLPSFHPQAGFVRIAFTHALRHLALETPYVEALRATLAGGGDTDTNACIVGGLSGALHGHMSLPENMVASILNCDTSRGRTRPEWLQTKNVLSLADSLLG